MRLLFFVFVTFIFQNLFGQIDPNFKIDSVYYKPGHMNFWFSHIREYEKLLNLDTIEYGYDSLQIRIWYNFPKSGLGDQLLCLKRQNSSWSATFHSRFAKENVSIQPKCDWNVLIKKLYSYNILNLADMYDIKGYRFAKDGWSYFIEISDRNHYRFYTYQHPESFKKRRFKDVRNLMKILKLIRKEFDIKLIGEIY